MNRTGCTRGREKLPLSYFAQKYANQYKGGGLLEALRYVRNDNRLQYYFKEVK